MTPEYHLARLAPPIVARDGDTIAPVTATPSNALVGFMRRSNAKIEDMIGADDLSTTPEEYLAANVSHKYGRKLRVAALAGPAPATWSAAGPDGPVDPAERFAPYPPVAAAAHLPTISTVLPGTSAGAEEAPPTDLPDVDSPDRVLGILMLVLPDVDNDHVGYVDIEVAPEARRRGLGGALHELAMSVLRAEGRRTAGAWTAHEPARPDAPRPPLVPPTNEGAIAQDDDTDWLLHRGWSLGQCERHSMARIDVTPAGRARAEAWRDESAARAGADYRLHTWEQEIPEQWLGAMAELLRVMSLDIPQADLDMAEEVWDAERVRDEFDNYTRAGMGVLLTAVEHVPSGELVAYTQFEQPAGRPAVAYQGNTIVLGAHRGHRLGLLVKAVNLLALMDRSPDARRIHTWNAGENAHMLAINELMGFRERTVEGAWERRVDGAATA